MTTSAPRNPALRSVVMSLASMAGGVTLAVIPAVTLSIASRVLSTTEQGFVSTFVTAGIFLGQLAFAVIVESRLSSPGTARHVVFPRWLAVVHIAAAAILAIWPTNVTVICVTIPVILAALEVGRGVSVSERLDGREIVSSVCVGLGAVVGLTVAYLGFQGGFVAVALGTAAATITRALPVPTIASVPDPTIRRWVVADTAITGVAFPALNALILALIGPQQAVLFAAVCTVTGLLSLPLTFMRLRLLKEHSRLDIAMSGIAVVGAVVVLGALEVAGVFGFLFGNAWRNAATLLPLLLACVWRAASLLTTIPFAALRRAGKARLLTGLRAGGAVFTFLLAAGGIQVHQLWAVFLGLVLAELATAVLYEFAHRRVLGAATLRWNALSRKRLDD